MNKKMIMITAGAGIICFVGSFSVAWFTRPAKPEPKAEATASGAKPAEVPGVPASGVSGLNNSRETAEVTTTSKQLKDLVYEVRENIAGYQEKLRGLEVREQRLTDAHDELKKDIDKLNSLRVELATMVERLKAERDKLAASRVEIDKTEKENIKTIALAYDKMDSSSAGKILTSMCVGEGEKGKVVGGTNSNMTDAVKILHYMGDRTKGKVLSELAMSEPKLAAILCEKLKQIIDKE
jgi:hypothetical protein